MTSTAKPRRTDRQILLELTRGAWRDGTLATMVACLMLAVALIGFRPIVVDYDPDYLTQGDPLNQMGWGAMLVLSVVAGLLMADARRLYALVSPSWLLLIAMVLLSVMRTPDPMAAFRGAVFTIIGIGTVMVVLSLPRTQAQMASVLAFAALALLILSYFAVFAFPQSGVHQTGYFEDQHAGLWRGIYPHKNVAGPVAACTLFVGLYLLRLGRPAIGGLIFVLAAIFVLKTGSKTTLGLIGITVFMVLLPTWTGFRRFLPAIFFVAVAVLTVATLGIVFIEPLKHWVNSIAPTFSYTGRTTLWDFGGRMAMERPWTGYGYGNFWQTPLVLEAEPHFDERWDFRRIGDSHSGYIDVLLMGGFPALAVTLLAIWIAPMADYVRVPQLKQNILFADVMMMIVIFTVMNAFLETFFFNRADPVWIYLLLGSFGLRIASRFTLHENGAPR
ncbi:O-antigen ligase [Notoacmeibacter sp. MSK16QG-6]|uniref:O-antigen ligase family protein n=1 Tax=Notoacmeibacter sp. MSK16QG-6 TaxID=2957982 RepID=UPI00209FC109|nr:O-antigen ligase [Notoacmeibacter sp. MSK16QG-6]MCP1198562.1 O-antigen ligase family protein [Notoacmeibacter sp. MSK16QG-6]